MINLKDLRVMIGLTKVKFAIARYVIRTTSYDVDSNYNSYYCLTIDYNFKTKKYAKHYNDVVLDVSNDGLTACYQNVEEKDCLDIFSTMIDSLIFT